MSELTTLGILLIFAAFVALLSVWFSLGAWILGPAVRHLGTCWEEGKMQAQNKVEQLSKGAYQVGVEDALTGRVRRAPVTPATFKPNTGTGTAPTPKFSITGREIR